MSSAIASIKLEVSRTRCESWARRAAEGLLLLREDYRDPLLRARGAAWNVALAAALGRRLSDAAADQQRLGRLMASQWQGAVLWWGFSRDGSLTEHLRRELREWVSAIGL